MERTVFYKKGDMNWRYLYGILRRWHENGWTRRSRWKRARSARGHRPRAAARAAEQGGAEQNAWMRRYIKR